MEQKSKTVVKEFSFKSSAIDEKNRQIRFLASTPDIDRDGERFLPSAFELHLAEFMTNPVFLACHQHRLSDGTPPVIGCVVRAWIDAAGLWSIVQFAESELGEKYWQLYRDGFMKAVSVGFIPIKWHEELIEGKRVTTYDEVEWIELSACAVPSNRGALARSKQRKLDFVGAKRDEKILAEVIERDFTSQGRDFDAECEEFGELLLRGEVVDGEWVLPSDGKEVNYADLVCR